MFTIEIRRQPAAIIAAIPHQGIRKDRRRLRPVLADDRGGGTGRSARRPVAFSYDDPSATPEAELRAHAGTLLPVGTEVPDTFDRIDVPEGEIGVVTVRGPSEGLAAAWAATCAEPLPAAGRKPGSFRPWEVYLNCEDTMASEDLPTEICVPLEGRP